MKKALWIVVIGLGTMLLLVALIIGNAVIGDPPNRDFTLACMGTLLVICLLGMIYVFILLTALLVRMSRKDPPAE